MDSGSAAGAVVFGRKSPVVGCSSPDENLTPAGVTTVSVEEIRSTPASEHPSARCHSIARVGAPSDIPETLVQAEIVITDGQPGRQDASP
jgi:hypothetical protein